jgi:DNA segregation ATPase FtsK/SpoIIIE-like protein
LLFLGQRWPKRRVDGILSRLWEQKSWQLSPVTVEVTVTKRALTVVLFLPVGMAPLEIEKMQGQIEWALGGPVEITHRGRACYLVRWLEEFPDFVEWEPPNLEKYILPWWLGKTRHGNMTIDLARDETYSVLLGGLSGMGKTNLIKGLVAGLEDRDVAIHAVDLKGVEIASLANHPKTVNFADEPEEVPPIIHYLLSQMKKRQKLFADNGIFEIKDYNGSLTRHLVIIDEYADLTDRKNDNLQRDLFKILRKGRAFGIHTVIGSQRTTGDIINTSLRNMFPVAVAFRTATRVDSEVLLNGHPDASELPVVKGRCVMMCGPELTMIQTPLAPI